jgi:hypothetical protein
MYSVFTKTSYLFLVCNLLGNMCSVAKLSQLPYALPHILVTILWQEPLNSTLTNVHVLQYLTTNPSHCFVELISWTYSSCPTGIFYPLANICLSASPDQVLLSRAFYQGPDQVLSQVPPVRQLVRRMDIRLFKSVAFCLYNSATEMTRTVRGAGITRNGPKELSSDISNINRRQGNDWRLWGWTVIICALVAFPSEIPTPWVSQSKLAGWASESWLVLSLLPGMSFLPCLFKELNLQNLYRSLFLLWHCLDLFPSILNRTFNWIVYSVTHSPEPVSLSVSLPGTCRICSRILEPCIVLRLWQMLNTKGNTIIIVIIYTVLSALFIQSSQLPKRNHQHTNSIF